MVVKKTASGLAELVDVVAEQLGIVMITYHTVEENCICDRIERIHCTCFTVAIQNKRTKQLNLVEIIRWMVMIK